MNYCYLIFGSRFISLRAPSKENCIGKLRRMGGFTMVEVMVVIAIMSILSVIAVPSFESYTRQARNSGATHDLETIADEIMLAFVENGRFPDSLEEINLHHLRDPWGNPYQYLKIRGADEGVKGKARKDRFMVPVNSDFDLYSMGPDGRSKAPFTAKHSRDDIVRASDGGYYGVAAGF